jgi:hypothetical protein
MIKNVRCNTVLIWAGDAVTVSDAFFTIEVLFRYTHG